MESSTNQFTFSSVDLQFASLDSKDNQERLLQWNLDATFSVHRFRFHGAFSSSGSDYERLVKELVTNGYFLSACGVSGMAKFPIAATLEQLAMTVINIGFFDKLTESGIVLPSGTVRGCYEETFDGVTVGDQLRELLANEDSENSCVFSQADKQEVIYHIFRILAVGGSMCQPDTSISRCDARCRNRVNK